ncbi:MAG: protein tyrosine phosphatase family protein [Isosphaeraceae bacterium]|nr:protein tyrosine phosphatase family protein [Isosphaeraceae bacterium]
MNVKRPITPNITIGDQPTEDDLKALKAEGYTGVVNLRNDGEPEQPLSTTAEGEQVRALGLDYLHYGVGSAPLSASGVESVVDFLARHSSEKVLVHCRKGGRAAALVLLDQAQRQGWTADEAVAKGKAMGLEVDGGLRTLVENYLRARPKA